ncbi:uncharacterized protein LOC134069275 [Sardina pilchardus]|uniref:uncharacterized protein LOC134069275 n=1 Tax=Sardina pilchardus TaxID=27697 RepID=UPI002E10A832
MDLFIILCLLFVDEGFSGTTQDVCPGQPVTIRKVTNYYDLFFEPRGSSGPERHVANRTHILLPSYQFKDGDVLIPEVTQQHAGYYFWSTPTTLVSRSQSVEVYVKACAKEREAYYGNEFILEVPKKASILEFTTEQSTDRRVLWSRINTDNKRGARGTVTGDRWKAAKITYPDDGRYTFRKENGVEVSSTNLYVRENLEYYDVRDVSYLESKPLVPMNEAEVTFIDSSQMEYLLFYRGSQLDRAFQMFQDRLRLQPSPSGQLELSIMGLKSSDVGRFEVKDRKGLALVIWLSERVDMTVPIAAGVVGGLVILTLIICCCVMRSRKKRDAAPVASPPPEYQPPIHQHRDAAPDASPPPVYQPPVYVHDPVVIYAPGCPPQPQPAASAGGGGGGGIHPAPSAPPDPGTQYGGQGDFS